MLRIGCHLSSSKGYLAMGKEAEKIDGGTFQFFTRNPRGGKAKELDQEDVKAFLDFAEQNSIAPILAHAVRQMRISVPLPETLWRMI